MENVLAEIIDDVNNYICSYLNEYDNYTEYFEYTDMNGKEINPFNISKISAFNINIAQALSLLNTDIFINVVFNNNNTYIMYLVNYDTNTSERINNYLDFDKYMFDIINTYSKNNKYKTYNITNIDDFILAENAIVSNSTFSGSTNTISQPGAIPGQPGTEGGLMTLHYGPLGKTHPDVPKRRARKRVLSSGWSEPMIWSEWKAKQEKSHDPNNTISLEESTATFQFQISSNLKKITRIQKYLIDAAQLMTEMTDEIKQLKSSSKKIETPLSEKIDNIETKLDKAINKMRDDKDKEGISTNIMFLIRKVGEHLTEMKEDI